MRTPLRRRLELVADVEHELRGPVAALGMVCERLRRRGGAEVYVAMVESQLARLRVALDDLAAAQAGGRAAVQPASEDLRPIALAAAGGVEKEVLAEWEAGVPPVVADRARLAQALGNLLANADEHGEGPVELRGRRVPGAVRVEVRNQGGPRSAPRPGRGRGLRIARTAIEQSGGRLDYSRDGDQVVAAIELPLATDDSRADAA